MTYSVEFSVRALRDLDHIFIEKNAVESKAAARWFNGLQRAVEGLANLPSRCPLAPESNKTVGQLRHLLYGHKPHVYRVICGIDEARKKVMIYHIRHGARPSIDLSEEESCNLTHSSHRSHRRKLSLSR